MTDCCAFFFSFLFLSIYRMYSFKFYIFYFLFDIILCMFKVQSRKASVLGLVADLITSYRSRQWGARWGVQHLPMFYCFRPPVCPWVNQNCRVICSLSISWWDHNVSITFVVAGGPASTRSQLWAISHHCIPQASRMCSLCPKNGTHCSSLCVKTRVPANSIAVNERLADMLRDFSVFDRL